MGYVIKRDASPILSRFQVEQWGLIVVLVHEAWLHLWTASEFLVPRRPGLCEKAQDYARTTDKICFGDDEKFEGVGRVAHKVMSGGGDLRMALTSSQDLPT